MASNRKLLGVVVVIGVAIGIVSQLRWMAKLEKGAASGPTLTNAVAKVSATNAVPAAATNVAAKVERTILPSPQTLKPSNSQTLKLSNLQTPQTPKPPRKPIAYDPKIPKARQVLLANRRIAVASGRSFPKKFCATQTPTARGTAPYVLISEVPVSRDVRIQAVADGAKVVGFLPNNALLVEADAQALKYLEEDATFTAAVEYEPTDKIQRAVMEGEKGERGERAGETVEATVVLLNPQDLDGIRQFVTDNGGIVTPGSSQIGKSFSATLPRLLVEQLAGKAEVKWIERRARLTAFNDVAVKPGLMNVTPVREAPLGLTGAGQVISTTDTGIDTGERRTMHPDIEHNLVGFQRSNTWLFWNKEYWGESTDRSGHGTHTAGSIVGDGTRSSGQFKGAAYGAKLWAWFCGQGTKGDLMPPLYQQGEYLWYDVERMFRPSSRYVAYIHSASWGGANNLAAYEDMSASVDEFVWGCPDFLPVIAAGNSGSGAQTVSPPATAKNVLSVGATESVRSGKGNDADNAAQIASFSSCGPCDDGRIKPDIVAPGTYVLSCLSTKASRCGWDDGSYTYYQYMGGTSMATPLTAGTAALVREWLAKYRERAKPSAALVKAILTGGATDLKNESGNNVLKNVPDTRQGWGRVNLADSIAPDGLGVFLADWLPFRAGTNFTFRVTTTNAAPLNVQLVWVDYPGEPSAAKALVNDLDLRVSAAGQTWLGNGGTEPDDVNNVESVRVANAVARTYTVCVECTSVPYEYNKGGAAAVYIRGAFDPKDVEADPKAGTVILVR